MRFLKRKIGQDNFCGKGGPCDLGGPGGQGGQGGIGGIGGQDNQPQ